MKKPEEIYSPSQRSLLRAKLILYRELIDKDEDFLTDTEVDLLAKLAEDEDVQEYLSKIGKPYEPEKK